MLIKHELNDVELELVTLPACSGGMSLDDPVIDSHCKHAASFECTTCFTALIVQEEFELLCHAFFDTRVFYPHAPSYRSRALPSLYRRFKGDKKHKYGERIREIEHSLFTPLVFSSGGGVDPP